VFNYLVLPLTFNELVIQFSALRKGEQMDFATAASFIVSELPPGIEALSEASSLDARVDVATSGMR
jgi:hypothetical protein